MRSTILIVDPCIPGSWDGFSVSRKYRGAEYKITVSNPAGVSKGLKSMIVDGKTVDGNMVPAVPAGSKNEIGVVPG